jgi:hypothetical protein
MDWYSGGTPPWVDEKDIDEEKQVSSDTEKDAKIKELKKENAELKNLVKNLEGKLKKTKITFSIF